MPKDEFCAILKSAFSDIALGKIFETTLAARIQNSLVVQFDATDPAVENTFFVDLNTIYDEFRLPGGASTVSNVDEIAAVAVLNQKLPKFPWNWRLLINAENAPTVEKWVDICVDRFREARLTCAQTKIYGFSVTPGPNTSFKIYPPLKDTPSLDPKKEVSRCYGCGVKGHTPSHCPLKKHPDWNSASIPWRQSPTGQKWSTKGHQSLPPKVTLAGGHFDPPIQKIGQDRNSGSRSSVSDKNKGSHSPPLEKNSGSSSSSSSSSVGKKGEIFPNTSDSFINFANLLSTLLIPANANLLSCSVSVPSQDPKSEPSEEKVQVLLDTGSLAGDFISSSVVDRLNIVKYIEPSSIKSVCSGLDNSCITLDRNIPLKVSFINELNSNINSLSSNAFLTLYHAKTVIIMPSKSVILSVKCQFTPAKSGFLGPIWTRGIQYKFLLVYARCISGSDKARFACCENRSTV